MFMDNKQIFTSLDTLKPNDKKDAAIKLLSDLSPQAKSQVLQQSGVEPPSQTVADIIWKIIIWTVAAVLILTAASIVYAVVFKGKTADTMQIVLTIFTSTMTFLTGVFVPSPTQKGK
jgi:hypothetical protein